MSDAIPQGAHRTYWRHWVPHNLVNNHGMTACGLDIDGPCDRHRQHRTGPKCQYGVAWTRSTDLAFDDGLSRDLKPCRPCLDVIAEVDIEQA